MALMREAKACGCDLIVYPELALTTFFPRWYFEDQAEIDSFFEREMPGPETRALFDLAREIGIGFYLGYAELTVEADVVRRYNTSILVDESGAIVSKYRKVHLPGHAEPEPWRKFQHLEKRYFEPGSGFGVTEAFGGVMGMAICNDRRWPETYRVMALQSAEVVMLGYNTPSLNIHWNEPVHLRTTTHLISLQANAYQNGIWVAAAAKCGSEDGHHMIGSSVIVAPTGEIVARTLTEDDEVICVSADLSLGEHFRQHVFNFAKHRRPEHYRLIVDRVGAGDPLS